jgi:hypothetical protein
VTAEEAKDERHRQITFAALWTIVLTVGAGFGVLGNWAIKTHEEVIMTGRAAGAMVQTMNAAVGDIRELRSDVNLLLKVRKIAARKAAVDSLKALEDEGFPGVLPFLGQLFFGKGRKK